MARTTITEINGQRYQIRKLLPDVGSYIYMRMMGVLLTASADDQGANEEPAANAPKPTEADKARMLCTLAFMRGLTFDDMKFVQRQCMQVTSRIEAAPTGMDIIIPIMNDFGRWAIPEIAEDISLVNSITTEVLVFSLASFFSAPPSVSVPTAGQPTSL